MSRKHDDKVALALAKERLVREGELYRVSTLHAKYQVVQALQPDRLLHGAVEHAIGSLQSRLGGMLDGQGGLLGGISLKTLLPYAVTIGSYVARKRLLKPAIAVAAVVALGVGWLLRHKSAPASDGPV
jgi:hypothetical protein